MLESFTDEQVRSACRARLENLERWLRRLIDERLSAQSTSYFDFFDENGHRLIKKRIADAARKRVAERGSVRYPRLIDAVLLEDLVTIICGRWPHFKAALATAFPEGQEEARTFMSRLVAPRNKLAHTHSVSQHEAEQVFCYSADIIASLKEYYRNV